MNMSNFIQKEKISQIYDFFRAGEGIIPVSRLVGVAKRTAQSYRKRLILSEPKLLCPCGKPLGHTEWCSFRFAKSPARQKFIYETWPLTRPIREKKPKIPIEKSFPFLRWPFLISGRDLPSYVKQINDVIPKTLPEYIRADVCQEMALAILEGQITEEEIPANAREYIKQIYKRYSEKWGTLSLYQPIKGTDDLLLIDTIDSERIHF